MKPPVFTGITMLTVVFTVALWIANVHDNALAVELPEGYMPLNESQAILDKTLIITLNPDLSTLSPAERGAAQKLLEAGEILHKLYENSLHHQARASYESLIAANEGLGNPKEIGNLLALFYLFKGPIARTLDNQYAPLIPVDGRVPGKNVYPWGISKEEVNEFLAGHPAERPFLLHLRTVVRKAEKDAVQADLAAIERYPALDVLHPELKDTLLKLLDNNDEEILYAVPYSVAYANDLFRVYELLHRAASIVEEEDIDFARYLRHRAVDLLLDDYEAGDASWVRGNFKQLNAQIGSYEVYDDELFAVKSFFSLSLLVRDEEQSSALSSAIRGLQSFEESLPYNNHKRIREDIPIGVYDVIADFGQARGSNTATILPNESHIARKYGRIILIRYNIISNPELFAIARDSWKAAVEKSHHHDLKLDGKYYRTLWHEIGHYLGPDLDKKGHSLGEVFQEDSQVLEELKSDLVSLFLAKALRDIDYYDDEQLRSVYASGIRRVLLKNQPRREQTYLTMELMQLNYYLENKLLDLDSQSGKLHINYDAYHRVVSSMLGEVLALQYGGDKSAADSFIERYRTWDEKIHGVIADNMKMTEKYRFVMVRYGVLAN